MSIYEKLQSMTPEEFVEAACLGVACLSGGAFTKERYEALKPVIDGLGQMMKDGFTELLTKMPWEEAVWELLESMAGKG